MRQTIFERYGGLSKISQTLKVGLALVDVEDWKFQFENANFSKWFAPNQEADEPLVERLPGINQARVQARLEDGRAFNFETKAQIGECKIPID